MHSHQNTAGLQQPYNPRTTSQLFSQLYKLMHMVDCVLYYMNHWMFFALACIKQVTIKVCAATHIEVPKKLEQFKEVNKASSDFLKFLMNTQLEILKY